MSDCQSNTTILRLPGMPSRLEITQITLVREVSVFPPKVFGGSLPSSLGSQASRNTAAQAFALHAHPRLRAVSDPQPGHASNTSCSHGDVASSGHAMNEEQHFPTAPSPPNTDESTSHFNSNSQCNVPMPTQTSKVLPHYPLSIDQARRAFDTFSMPSLSKHSMPSSLACAERRPLTSPATNPAMGAPTTLKSSTSLLAILNGSSPDTPGHVIPRLGVESLALASPSALDPPVVRPKPIGTTSVTVPRRRQSDTSIGVAPRCLAVGATPAAHPGDEIGLAPPWPPVSSSSSSF